MSFTAGGTYRWMSPELLDPERFGMPGSGDNRPTRQSDCYALGMVIYEVSVCSCEWIRCCEQLTLGIVGVMWTSPIPRDTVGCSSYQCDYGGGPTTETGGGEAPGL